MHNFPQVKFKKNKRLFLKNDFSKRKTAQCHCQSFQTEHKKITFLSPTSSHSPLIEIFLQEREA